jgi:hypothetical protein
MSGSARASISISLLAAAAALAGETPPDPGRVATLRLEAGIAQTPAVYLVLDPPRQVLEIKSRGTVLDSIALVGIEVVTQQPLLAERRTRPVTVPAVWRIVGEPSDDHRELIAPVELRPMPKEEDEESDDGEAATPAPAGPTPTPTPVPEPEATYRAHLDGGWDLLICEQLPPRGLFDRFAAAVRDGWQRLRDEGRDEPPAIALAMAAEDARRLHHVLRSGTSILVAAGAP